MYYVTGTYRDDACNQSSAIAGLVLDQHYDGFTVHSVEKLKALADKGQLKVYSNHCGFHVQVIIYHNPYYDRYVATTKPDGLECNNLLSRPIYYPAHRNGTTTTYSQCSF